MSSIFVNLWSRATAALRRKVLGPENPQHKGPIEGRVCLAQDIAGCNDYNHCENCSSLEQTLRVAPWMEKNWRRVQTPRGAKAGEGGAN